MSYIVSKYYISDEENNMANQPVAAQQYALNLQPPEQFVIDIISTSMTTTWEGWRDTLDIFLIASSINDTKCKKALLLQIGGKELQNIHGKLNDENDIYEKARKLLDLYFKPKINLTFERKKFLIHINMKIKQHQHL